MWESAITPFRISGGGVRGRFPSQVGRKCTLTARWPVQKKAPQSRHDSRFRKSPSASKSVEPKQRPGATATIGKRFTERVETSMVGRYRLSRIFIRSNNPLASYRVTFTLLPSAEVGLRLIPEVTDTDLETS